MSGRDTLPANIDQQSVLLAHNMFDQHKVALEAAAKISTHTGYQTISSAAVLREYERLTESKSYLGVPYTDAHGNLVMTQSIDEFCRQFLPHGADWFRKQRALLDTLGDAAVDFLTALGVSGRRLAAIKDAPDELRETLAQAVKAGDKDRALFLADRMAAEVRAAAEASEALATRAGALEQIIERKDKRINELDERLTVRDRARAERQAAVESLQVDITRAASDALDALAQLDDARNALLSDTGLPDPDVSLLAVTCHDLAGQVYASAQDVMARCEAELSGWRNVAAPADGAPAPGEPDDG